MSRLGALIVKELQSYLRDPRTRAILIGPPLMQLLIFSFAATLEVKNIDIAVLNHDNGTLSSELLERLAVSSLVNDIKPAHSPHELAAMIDNREVLLGLQIGANLSRDALAGQSPTVQVLLDGRRANSAQIAQRYITEITTGLDTDRNSSSKPDQIVATTSVRHRYNPNLSYRWFIVPSLSGVLALMISLLITALSIARERELGTFDQLLVTPMSSGEIIIGKSVPALILGAALALVMILAGVFVFQIPFTGSALGLALSLPPFILAGVGVGLLVSSVAQTQQQAILGAFTIVIPIVLTSGFATPIENMPDWLQTASLANPLRHFLVIVQGSFLKALPPVDILANTVPLVLIAAVTLGAAVWVLNRRLV